MWDFDKLLQPNTDVATTPPVPACLATRHPEARPTRWDRRLLTWGREKSPTTAAIAASKHSHHAGSKARGVGERCRTPGVREVKSVRPCQTNARCFT